MRRSTRIEYPGACYHVMSRGVARMATFRDDEDREAFDGRIAQRYRRTTGAVTHAAQQLGELCRRDAELARGMEAVAAALGEKFKLQDTVR